jgi:hypothetical protein
MGKREMTEMEKEITEHRSSGEREAVSSEAAPVDRIAKAHQELMARLHAAWNEEDVIRQCRDEFAEMQNKIAALSDPKDEPKRLHIYADYLDTVRELMNPEKIQSRIDMAHDEYVQSIKDFWLEIEPKTLHADALSKIGECIAWAGYYSSFTPLCTSTKPDSL